MKATALIALAVLVVGSALASMNNARSRRVRQADAELVRNRGRGSAYSAATQASELMRPGRLCRSERVLPSRVDAAGVTPKTGRGRDVRRRSIKTGELAPLFRRWWYAPPRRHAGNFGWEDAKCASRSFG